MLLKRFARLLLWFVPVFAGAAQEPSGPGEQPSQVYARPLHLTYALAGGKVLPQSDEEILAAIDAVPGGVTSVNPFLLNTADPSRHSAILDELKKRRIAVFLGVGRKPFTEDPKGEWGIDSPNMRRIAKGFAAYSDSIRVDNLEGYYAKEGREPIQSYIDYLRSIGFKHIMLNPWPVDKGAAVPFEGAESTILEVMLDFDRGTFELHPATTNWSAKEKRVAIMRAYDPSVQILINYESEPQHRALARLEAEKPGSSTRALEVAAAQCQANGWYWCPPWTKIYDPLRFGTWDWLVARLGSMHSKTPQAPR